MSKEVWEFLSTANVVTSITKCLFFGCDIVVTKIVSFLEKLFTDQFNQRIHLKI